MMHCHIPYPMEVGLARAVDYDDGPTNPDLMAGEGHRGIGSVNSMHDPVIGGMISSLLHILIVTPVIFLCLLSREFNSEMLQVPFHQESPE